MKIKSGFLIIFILAAISVATLLASLANTSSNQITTYYGEMQEKQQTAWLGNFTESEKRKSKGETIIENDETDEEGVIVENAEGEIEDFDEKALKGSSSSMTSQKTLIVSITAILLVSVLLFSFLKKRKNMIKNELRSPANKKNSLDDHEGRAGVIPDNPEFLDETDKNEIRMLVQNWQANLSPNKKKRKDETIHEWFVRIKGPMNIIPIYEKVRYGEASYTNEEYKLVYKELT
ncbi:hypothetical protein FZC79_18300 [Rossellomorea vietnamensis]|uniref:Uncharacterized protein n=1 Tax=Rossellomorea vietnamensis TaxID=218284 RepID=A0A5D4K858_9BACI|nr:hypothetical protein [Rossellomorea vietnamensis]TYR73587.1 hypothetical protein FZC79_18300 [Rossellomorea vietnamensis]